jgi:hypothetical protein
VTFATILPKGGPQFSCEGAQADFLHVTTYCCACTNTALVPKIPKPFVELTVHKKKHFEKVPKGGSVIVVDKCGG